MTRVRIWKLVGVALACIALAACSGDGREDQPSTGSGSETSTPADSDTDTGGETPGNSELDAIALGLRVSLQAERVEVIGDTIHIYPKVSDGVVPGAGSECVVASRVVPEGITVIVHRDGGETTC